MPLAGSAPVLSTALRAAMLARPELNATDGPALTALCDVISQTVLAHVIANAVVTTTFAGAVTACASGAGTAAGTTAGTVG